MYNRIQELFDIIEKARNELKEIRSKCPHEHFFIGDWSDGPGRIYKVKICTECMDNLGVVDAASEIRPIMSYYYKTIQDI